MKAHSVLKGVFCLLLAAVSSAAWDLHLLGTRHEAGENCQVCAVAAAPELNADCGSALLAAPQYFSLLKPPAPLPAADFAALTAFYGRAPPTV